MSEAHAALLELGRWSVVGTRGKVRRRILKQRLSGKHLHHLLRVLFPIRCAVKVAARREPLSQQSHKGRLDQTALVVALFWPGVGEKNMDARQRRWLCGLVFQFPERHFLGLSVAQELKLGQRRLPAERLEAVLAQVGLADLPLGEAPERLSGGQQRRLSLAVQLLRDPKVLLLSFPLVFYRIAFASKV